MRRKEGLRGGGGWSVFELDLGIVVLAKPFEISRQTDGTLSPSRNGRTFVSCDQTVREDAIVGSS